MARGGYPEGAGRSFSHEGADMKRGLAIAGASLFALASLIVGCSNTSMSGSTPLHAAMLRCNAGTASSGSLTVTSTCNGVTSSGHTMSITFTATGSGAPFHVMSTNQSSVTVAQGTASNQFMARAVAAGSSTVQVTDAQGDDVNETEEVDDVNETPEPAESESPEH